MALRPYGVDLLQLGFATPPRPPESVKQAIESKIAATQLAERAENEKRQAIAEAAKAVEIARAGRGERSADEIAISAVDAVEATGDPRKQVEWSIPAGRGKWNGAAAKVDEVK